MEFSAKQIAAFIQGEIIGDENIFVMTEYRALSLSFLIRNIHLIYMRPKLALYW